MTRLSTIELFKEEMKFSVGHFTIFSETVRENLHGHNYNVYVSILTEIDITQGLAFDYRDYRDKFYNLCAALDESVLLPTKSKYLTIEEEGDYYHCRFADETLIFLKRDVKCLPISNVTVEELSNYFIQQVIKDESDLKKNNIHAITVKVFSGPGQSGSSFWKKE